MRVVQTPPGRLGLFPGEADLGGNLVGRRPATELDEVVIGVVANAEIELVHAWLSAGSGGDA
jgi:hypothetical protein